MAYFVTWKKQPGHIIINTERFDDLHEALADAKIYMPGPFPVDITVTDEEGNQYYRGVTGPSGED
jgi:hypothetical protein